VKAMTRIFSSGPGILFRAKVRTYQMRRSPRGMEHGKRRVTNTQPSV
jgi:hypothetical protein